MDAEMKQLYMGLVNALDDGNMLRARSEFDNCLLWYGDNVEYIKHCYTTLKKYNSFFDEHDGEVLIEDERQWSEEYLENLQSELLSNYSKERLAVMLKILFYLNREGAKSLEVNNKIYKEDRGLIATDVECELITNSHVDNVGFGFVTVNHISNEAKEPLKFNEIKVTGQQEQATKKRKVVNSRTKNMRNVKNAKRVPDNKSSRFNYWKKKVIQGINNIGKENFPMAVGMFMVVLVIFAIFLLLIMR